jgi:hypothetical protein
MTWATSGTRFPTQRYAFEPIPILYDVSTVRLMCVLRLQGRVCIPHGPVITLMGHVIVPYSTCMMRYFSQKHKQVIRLVVGPRAAIRMRFPSQMIITFTHSLANPIMFSLFSTRHCGVPLDYKREASRSKEGGGTTHTYRDHA